jgi:hypothetical protein
MNGLFTYKEKHYQTYFKKLVYNEIFDNMGDLLINLYIVDLIIKENTNIDSHWQ